MFCYCKIANMSYLYNNEQAAAFVTHSTKRDIGPYGNEGSLDGNGNISRLNVYNMPGGRRKTTRKTRMNGGGYVFNNLEPIGHGHHAEVHKTMTGETQAKHFEPPSWSELSGKPQLGGASAADTSYLLVDKSTVKYPMEGVPSENGVVYHGFNGGEDISTFAGSYAPVQVSVHKGGAPQFLSLWKRVCPGAVAIYNAELKHDMKNPKVVALIKYYSKVFRAEEDALKSHRVSKVKRLLSEMRTALNKARKCLVSLKSKMIGTHTMIVDMHLGRVGKHLASLRQTKKRAGKLARRKTMRGGYHQYDSNTVQSSGYSPVLDSNSAEASPHNVQPHAGNAIDNYNHFTGQGVASPILDHDVSKALEAAANDDLF